MPGAFHTVHDAVTLSTRERTADGFLRGKAIITKAGILEYDASMVGGESGNTVRIRQTPDSVFHPDTLRSVQNAAVTIGHPIDFVNPKTWGTLAVGSVSNPHKVGTDHLGVDILFGDEDVIAMVEGGGWEELSIGKRFSVVPAEDDPDADFQTTGPIDVNHVAVVERGRAGPDVRVLDSKSEDAMTPEQMTQLSQAVATAVQGAMPQKASDVDTGALTSAVTDSLSPLLQAIQKQAKDADEERKRADAVKTAEELKKVHDEAVKAADEAGYKRGISEGQMRADALSLVADPAMRTQLAQAKTKDLLIAATQDVAPGAAAMDETMLHGILIAKKAMVDASGVNPNVMAQAFQGQNPMQPNPANGYVPFGAQAFANTPQQDAQSPAQKNMNAYHDAVDQAFKTGNIVNIDKAKGA